MANVDAPSGLQPAFHLSGGIMRLSEYKIADSTAVAIFSGDLVHLTGTGAEIQAADAAADAPFVGVFQGVRWRATDGSYKYAKHWTAADTTLGAEQAVALVSDDPDIVYVVQADGAFVAADVGNTADIAYTVGSTLTGVSKTELDSSDIGTGLNLWIRGLLDHPDNAFGANAKVLVTINEHSYRNAGVASFEQI